MRIALIDSTPKAKHYAVSLLKLSALARSQGHEPVYFANCKLPKAGEFDEIWVTTRFTFHIPQAQALVKEAMNRAARVRVGGVSASLMPDKFAKLGADVHVGLLPEAECLSPDYSILPEVPPLSITHTSRGCIRKCKFCMVSILEPEFKARPQWIDDIHPQAKHIEFYDNNWTAKPRNQQVADVEMIKALKASGQIKTVDFNQGMDVRLIADDPELQDLIASIPNGPYLHVAFDSKAQDGYFQRAMKALVEKGVKRTMVLTLYNFMDTPEDFYCRARKIIEVGDWALHKHSSLVQCFPMRYQPVMDINSRGFVGKHWSKKMITAFGRLVSAYGGGSGALTCGIGLAEFEYWLGKDAGEFRRLLNYPKIRQLCERKMGARLMARASGGQAWG